MLSFRINKIANDVTVIFPVNNFKKFKKYILWNSNYLIKKKICTYILSNKKIPYLKKNFFIKSIASKKFSNTNEKIFYALKSIKTKYVFFLREDDLLCMYGFNHLYNQIKRNNKICTVQGIKFLVQNKKIHPHIPNSFNFYSQYSKHTFRKKILNIFNNANESYWTIHKTGVVEKFFSLVIKKKFFCDPKNNWFLTNQYYDLYFILFILIHGDIKFENIPINLKIKFRKIKKIGKPINFEEAQKNKFFIRNLEVLSSLLEKNRKIKRSEAKKIILLSLNQYFKFPKPRNVIKNFNIFQLFFYRVNRKYRKIKEYFSKNQLISRYDIYYFTQLNNNLYSKLTSNYKIKQELNILYNNVINPN